VTDRASRVLLGLAAVAVCFAAADTYVVVLALPDMMTGVGVPIDDLQRAAPIISGFLLGYIAIMPLIGRIADLRGRLPVLVGSLVVFAIGSLVTAAAYDLPSMVAGRCLQGVGAGGLLPATLALVADLYPPRERSLPLGVVNAVQELGNVLGPLYGAVVLAFGDWRDIFWINLVVGLVLAAALLELRPRSVARSVDWLLVALAATSGLAVSLVMLRPTALVTSVSLGAPFVPFSGDSRWFTPLGVVALVLVLLAVVRLRPQRWADIPRDADLVSALLLSFALGGVILAFATADPQVQVFSPAGPWLLAVSALASFGFWHRNRSVRNPLVPPGALRRTPAWGAMVVSFFVGSALIAAVVDIPIFARVTVYNDSQVSAALVLMRFLVGLPVGAFLGGWLAHRFPAGAVAAVGMAASCLGFAWMSQWGLDSLRDPVSTVPLVLGGLGVGLAMVPVNAALLSATDDEAHGVASALLVVSRTIGKLVGISALTTIGLRRFYAEQRDLPAPREVCPDGRSRCAEYSLILKEAGLTQLQTIFVGAAVCCAIAGLVALVVFRHADTRRVKTSALEAGIG
jgi:MFS family permease